MRVAFRDHQFKGIPYARALHEAGHDIVRVGDPADVLLIDADIDLPQYRQAIDGYLSWGARVFVYPHGAEPMVLYDGVYTPTPEVTHLVPAAGHARTMASYGFRGRVEVCGFPFCPLKDFTSRDKAHTVLFAPYHPAGNGWLHPELRALNAEAYYKTRKLRPGRLLVQLYGTPETNGLPNDADVEWVQSDLNVGWETIDRADLVVSAAGTFHYLAVARGVPTVVFAQDVVPHEQPDPQSPRSQVRSWDRYRHIYRYPVDLDQRDAVGRALRGDLAVRIWRSWMVGQPLDVGKLCEIVEGVPVVA